MDISRQLIVIATFLIFIDMAAIDYLEQCFFEVILLLTVIWLKFEKSKQQKG